MPPVPVVGPVTVPFIAEETTPFTGEVNRPLDPFPDWGNIKGIYCTASRGWLARRNRILDHADAGRSIEFDVQRLDLGTDLSIDVLH